MRSDHPRTRLPAWASAGERMSVVLESKEECAVAEPAGTVFDVVILGGGSGGYACALRAAQLGMTVALVEKDKLGGTCLHQGCIPTKALLHAAEVADPSRESEQFGVRTTFDGIDMPGVNAYKDGVVARLYKGLQGLVKSRKITYVEGIGRLAGPTTVEVDGTSLRGPPRRARDRLGAPSPCPAWRSTASGSSPATTRCGWTRSRRRWSSSAAA